MRNLEVTFDYDHPHQSLDHQGLQKHLFYLCNIVKVRRMLKVQHLLLPAWAIVIHSECLSNILRSRQLIQTSVGHWFTVIYSSPHFVRQWFMSLTQFPPFCDPPLYLYTFIHGYCWVHWKLTSDPSDPLNFFSIIGYLHVRYDDVLVLPFPLAGWSLHMSWWMFLPIKKEFLLDLVVCLWSHWAVHSCTAGLKVMVLP